MSSSTSAVERVQTMDQLPDPTGPYAWTVTYGDLIFVSGLRGIDAASGEPVADEEQRLGLIFARLRRILERNESCPEHVLSTRVYVTDMGRLRPLVNDAFTHFFGDALPTRTIVQVAALNQDDSVEIEVIAGRCG